MGVSAFLKIWHRPIPAPAQKLRWGSSRMALCRQPRRSIDFHMCRGLDQWQSGLISDRLFSVTPSGCITLAPMHASRVLRRSGKLPAADLGKLVLRGVDARGVLRVQVLSIRVLAAVRDAQEAAAVPTPPIPRHERQWLPRTPTCLRR